MSSKGYLAIWAGSALLALAGCDAGNQQEPGAPATEDQSADNMAMYEPDDSTGTQGGMADEPTTAEDPYSTTDPSMAGDEPMMGSDRSQTEMGQTGMSPGESLESMSPDQIVGKTVVSAEGEEIGEVQEIVQDPATSEKFAVVDVGGFLGVGQKSVTIGLAELHTSQSGEDRLESDLTRQTLETKTEYTPGEYQPVDQSSGQQTQ
jgi:hypothetical protein